jgi:hypothetical protein
VGQVHGRTIPLADIMLIRAAARPWYDDLLVNFKTKGLFDRREDGLVLSHESGLVAK